MTSNPTPSSSTPDAKAQPSTIRSSMNPTTAQTIFAPCPFPHPRGPSVFLAGSIDNGAAIEWQIELATQLYHLPITILNPRRLEWNASWKQEIGFAPFREQVEWELDMQEEASVIAMYFGKESTAPISLLELGLSAKSGKMIVCCPEGYWRRGNVQIVCKRFGIQCVETLEELRDAVIKKFEYLKKEE